MCACVCSSFPPQSIDMQEKQIKDTKLFMTAFDVTRVVPFPVMGVT